MPAMIISLIAAMGNGRVIGIENKLPWRMPADMAWFRKNTLGKTILMGRKTFDSFGAKPLPQRQNVIISRDATFKADGCLIFASIEQALEQLSQETEVMVIGGTSIYEQLLPQAQRLYLTYIQEDFQGDSFFPAFDEQQWHISFKQEHKADEKNPHDYRFVIFEHSTAKTE